MARERGRGELGSRRDAPFTLRYGGGGSNFADWQFFRSLTEGIISTIGMLSGDELQKGPTPRPVNSEGIDNLNKAWTAVTTSDPVSLTGFIDKV